MVAEANSVPTNALSVFLISKKIKKMKFSRSTSGIDLTPKMCHRYDIEDPFDTHID